ncbi:hypothetical protein VNO77_29350 [Canavalia gladiata]|uniref:Uncharacterized protein n=1 Tax=Canavalia gladiata TaxID=3824 RepID=A0AAN9L1B2_CANGL
MNLRFGCKTAALEIPYMWKNINLWHCFLLANQSKIVPDMFPRIKSSNKGNGMSDVEGNKSITCDSEWGFTVNLMPLSKPWETYARLGCDINFN